MKDYIPIITALIAFVGTVLGIVITYRKWRKEQNAKRFDQFEMDKQAAYKKLWTEVEDFNIKVRLERVTSREFSNNLQNLNSFLLKSGIYIDEEDMKVANEYVSSIFNFQKVVKGLNNPEADAALEETRNIPESILNEVKEIGEAQKKALELREMLLKKIKLVLSGE